MKITINKQDSDFHFASQNEEGNLVYTDGAESIGGLGQGMRPMQLLLSAVGSCSAIDIVSILKKQKQEIKSFQIVVEGDREQVEEYTLFRKIHLHFKLSGKVELEKAQRAAQLSMEKYCSVSKTLEPTATITYTVSVHE